MKLITRDTDYAVRALAFIAKNKCKLATASELVDKIKIPRPFLRKILQILTRHKILLSYKGVCGGFRLAKDPKKILITDLIDIFQGRLRFNECFFRKELCPNRRTCFLKKKIDRIEGLVTKELKSINIASLIK
ncbi:MAG: Rrf2 family transcriptional regulator [Candidatus Omnitrophota bacterium]